MLNFWLKRNKKSKIKKDKIKDHVGYVVLFNNEIVCLTTDYQTANSWMQTKHGRIIKPVYVLDE